MSGSCAVSLPPTCCRSAAPSPSASVLVQRARTGGLVRLDLTQPEQLAPLRRYGPFAIDARVCVHGDPNPVVEIGDSFSDLPRFTYRLDQAELKCVRALLSACDLTLRAGWAGRRPRSAGVEQVPLGDHVVVADASAPGPIGAAVDAVAATIGDAPEFLDVQLDQLAGMLALVAHHRAAGAVQMGQSAHAVAAQHPRDRRAGHAQLPGEAMGALAAAPPGRQHPTDLAGGEGMGTAAGRELRSARPAAPSAW